jgi:hypothetical protein
MANNPAQWLNSPLLFAWLKTIELDNHCHLALTYTNSPLLPQALSQAETDYAQQRFTKGLDTPRGQQWLLGRQALLQLAVSPPLQFPNPNYSLSHCGDWAVALKATHGLQTTSVGVDIEKFRPLAPRATYYYLHPSEVEVLTQVPAHHEQAYHRLRLWTAKEALFKADPLNANQVMKSYRIHSPLANQSIASSNNGQVFKLYTLASKGWDDCDVTEEANGWFMAIALLQT